MASNPVNNEDDPAYFGNKFFVQNEYEKALDEYSKSIEKHPDVAKLYTNRAMTYWKLNRPYDAWKDAEAGLKIEPNNEKLIYRKCTTLLEMRRFHEASQFLDEGLKRMGGVPEKYKNEFKTLIDDMERLKTEFVDGRYDLMAMIEESKSSAIMHKHADYYAWNKFEIREIEGKGRGLVAKERIELGVLLIACEAMFFMPCGGEASSTINLNAATAGLNRMVDGLRKKLLHRPDLGEQLYRLYAGPRLGRLENWKEGEPMDVNRLVQIYRFNGFTDPDVLDKGTIGSDGHNSGICFVPSYINHTCIDNNCDRYYVGNFVFVRATKAIEVGEELLFSYVTPSLTFGVRHFVLYETEGIECHCRLCEIERHDSRRVKDRLKEIRRNLDRMDTAATLASYPNDIELLDRFMEELRGYRPGLSLDYLLIRCRKSLLQIRVRFSDPQASVPMLKQLIDDLVSAGDFFEALFLTKGLYAVALRSECEGDRDECDKITRGIAKMFFHDERVAALYKKEIRR